MVPVLRSPLSANRGHQQSPSQERLVDKQVNPRVVMAVGGWDLFQAIEPYLNAPTADIVNETFEDAGLA